jgi:acyl dehydratase
MIISVPSPQPDSAERHRASGYLTIGSFQLITCLFLHFFLTFMLWRNQKEGFFMPGFYFEQFSAGQMFEHELRRTVTEMDNMLFSNMTLNPQPLHIDRHFCETQTEWGQPLMNSLFTLGLMIGIAVTDTTVGTTIANLGMSDVRFPHPLFQGDTVHVTTEIIGKRESKSRPDAGIVEFEHKAFNQNDVLVAICRRNAFMRRQPA